MYPMGTMIEGPLAWLLVTRRQAPKAVMVAVALVAIVCWSGLAACAYGACAGSSMAKANTARQPHRRRREDHVRFMEKDCRDTPYTAMI